MMNISGTIALVGNPNTGKSTVFNALTGLHQHVGNYPGVTVERNEGFCTTSKGHYRIVDLPGTYALNPKSMDEQITYRSLIGTLEGESVPDAVVLVVDASNLERNLYLLTQLLDLHLPTILVLNLTDISQAKGIRTDVEQLSKRLRIPVIETVANKGNGIEALKALMDDWRSIPVRTGIFEGSEAIHQAATTLVKAWLEPHTAIPQRGQLTEAFRLINHVGAIKEYETHPQVDTLRKQLYELRSSLAAQGINSTTGEILHRYDWINKLCAGLIERDTPNRGFSDKVDAVVTHPVLGPGLLLMILLLMFQSIFSWAEPFMDLIDHLFIEIAGQVQYWLPESWFTSLLTDGLLAGLGGVVIFLPQILILFLFISILEGSGYMARAAFVMDGFMTRIGLHGRSVAPLISGFACAIPGIMATRTIEHARDRLITIMVLPFMACSARLPVYALMTAAFVPNETLWGIISWQGLTFFGLYLFGIVTAILAALVFKRVMKGNEPTPFLMELPDYKWPDAKWVFRTMVQRGWIFVVEAGKVIIVISIALWFLASYPKVPLAPSSSTSTENTIVEPSASQASRQLEQSYAGQFGKWIEPAIEPLGFDWKIGIALMTSFAAREVLVGTLNTIYSVESEDDMQTLRQKLIEDRDPDTGARVYGFWSALSLMVFFALACQCMSTLAIVRRETNSWKWPLIMFTYMTTLAWIASFTIYQLGTRFFPL
jgi:ferrous iron transport protein B